MNNEQGTRNDELRSVYRSIFAIPCSLLDIQSPGCRLQSSDSFFIHQLPTEFIIAIAGIGEPCQQIFYLL